MSPFKLYPEERHWWSFSDYGAVIDVLRELQPRSVLEFGPGSSTLALIEGGAAHIDTCEDDEHWAEVYEDRIEKPYHDVVSLHRYVWSNKLTIPAIDGQTWDLALIDGPREANKRVPVLNYALSRCAAVLLPMDDSRGLANRLTALEKSGSHYVQIRETGPLAGRFALITRKSEAAPQG